MFFVKNSEKKYEELLKERCIKEMKGLNFKYYKDFSNQFVALKEIFENDNFIVERWNSYCGGSKTTIRQIYTKDKKFVGDLNFWHNKYLEQIIENNKEVELKNYYESIEER